MGLYIDIIYFVVSILVPVGISWGSTVDEWPVKMTISIFASHNTVICAVVCISKPLYCVMQNKNMAGGNYCFDWPFVAFQVCERIIHVMIAKMEKRIPVSIEEIAILSSVLSSLWQ